MSNKITINLDEIKQLSDETITDAETIRQLAIHSIETNDSSLLKKINPKYAFLGLYPYSVRKYDIKPDSSKT